MEPLAALRKQYNGWAADYDARTLRFTWSAPQSLLEATIACKPPAASLRVLDVGVGTGQASVPYLEAGACVIGLDVANEMLQQAQANWPQFHALLEYDFNNSLTKAGLKQGFFDLIISCGALHFAQALQNTLADLRAMLAPGGILAFTFIPSQPRTFSSATRVYKAHQVASMLRQLNLRIVDQHSFVAYYEGGNRDDPVIYQRVVAGCPQPAQQLPKALQDIDRCACIDRQHLYAVAQRPLMTAQHISQRGDMREAHAANQQLLQALQKQLATGDLAPQTLPLPNVSAAATAGNGPQCDVLVLTAHPDDETVYAGGLIAGLTEAGQRVHLVVASDGAGGRQSHGTWQTGQRFNELQQAAQTLGISSLEHLDFEDFGKYRDAARSQPVSAADTLRRWGLQATLDALVSAIRRHRPRVLLTFDGQVDPNYSLHGHHLAVGIAALAAFHLAADKAYGNSAQHGPWAVSEQWSLVPRYQPVAKVVTVEIDPRRKLQALHCYPSQKYSTQRLMAALADNQQNARFESYRVLQKRQQQSLPIALVVGAAPEATQHREPTYQQWQRAHGIICRATHPRQQVVELCHQQAHARSADQAVLTNLERLRSPTTVAVVTGQQVGLLGGPVFTLYKALGAVALARRLESLGIPAVPVFWMASYDHDLDEIQRLMLPDQTGTRQCRSLGLTVLGKPVGKLPLGQNIDPLLNAVEGIFLNQPHGPEILAQLRRCYRPEATLAEAFARWIGFLTDGLGLVILDPGSRAFASLARPVIAQALFDSAGCQAALAQGRNRLLAQGKSETIRTDRDVLPVFFTDENGRRCRLQRVANGFLIPAKQEILSDSDVRRLLDMQPERFTPSAVLRPICQDAVLPTIAYLGGPTELRYMEQLPALYQWAGIAMPYRIPRPSFTVIDATAADALVKAGGACTLLGDTSPWVKLGRSGLPEPVTSVCDGLLTLEGHCYHLAKRMASRQLIMASVQSLEKAIVEQLNRLSAELQSWNRARPRRALDWVVKQIPEWLLALHWELSRNQVSSLSPWPLIKLARLLASLARTLLREGRRDNASGVAAWKNMRFNGFEQERQMSVPELVTCYGISIVPRLLSMAHSDGVTRLVTLRETD